MFLVGEDLRPRKSRTLGSPIFNYSADKLDRRVCGGGIHHYMPTKGMLMDYTEKEEILAYRRNWAVVDASVSRVTFHLELEKAYPNYLCLSGGRYQFNCNNWYPHSDHMYHQHTMQGNPGSSFC